MHTNTGRHLLQLRALATSDRCDHAMTLTLQRLRKSDSSDQHESHTA
jgi:hypothetical protein